MVTRRFCFPAISTVIVVLAGFIAQIVQHYMNSPFPEVGNIDRGLPPPALPEIKGNELSLLLPRALIVAAISSVETIAIGKAFAEKNGYRVNPSQVGQLEKEVLFQRRCSHNLILVCR